MLSLQRVRRVVIADDLEILKNRQPACRRYSSATTARQQAPSRLEETRGSFRCPANLPPDSKSRCSSKPALFVRAGSRSPSPVPSPHYGMRIAKSHELFF